MFSGFVWRHYGRPTAPTMAAWRISIATGP